MFGIFPNPASESFTIHLVSEQDDRVNIKLLSVEGIVVYSQPWQKVNRGFNDIIVATSGLPTGVYYVSVTVGENKAKVEKLVIINN
jgi:hypothetical protein